LGSQVLSWTCGEMTCCYLWKLLKSSHHHTHWPHFWWAWKCCICCIIAGSSVSVCCIASLRPVCLRLGMFEAIWQSFGEWCTGTSLTSVHCFSCHPPHPQKRHVLLFIADISKWSSKKNCVVPCQQQTLMLSKLINCEEGHHCLSFVKKISNIGQTTLWVQGSFKANGTHLSLQWQSQCLVFRNIWENMATG